MNKKLLIGIIAGICVVALVLGLVLGLSNCKGPEPTEPSQTVAPTDEPTDPPAKETEPEVTAPVVEGGISYYSGMPDYSWYDPTSGQKEYVLYTADQLYGLAELVNTMNMKFEGATIKLANNMVINEGDASKWNKDDFMVPWAPIGKAWGSAFSGTIDGQGHYISGLFSVQAKNNAFICYSQGATIKNLAIVNSYFQNTNEDDVQAEVLATFVGRGRGVTLQNLYSDAILVGGGYSTGGIVGYTQSAWDAVTKDCLVDSCVFAGQIKNAGGKGTGGILGHDNGSKYSVTVKNCLFIGTLDSKNANCGGIVGFFSGESKLINCVSAGKVTSTSKDFNGVALIGSASGSSTVSNNYYVSTKSGKAIGAGSPAVEEGNNGLVRATMKGKDVAKVMTALDFAKAWSAMDDTYPIPTGVKAMYDLVKKPLTEDTSDDSDKATSGGSTGTTTPAGDVDTTWYSDAKKEFTLSNVKQLYGLAQLVNEGKTFEGKTVKLSKDLVINSGSASKWNKDTKGLKAWTPIGTSNSKSFKGTFDGQGHYISGIFSVQKKDNGLFGYANGATIKNLAVVNSFFENTGATAATDRASGKALSALVATGENVKLSGLFSNATLKNAGTDLGGIIGYAKGTTSVDGCAFAGTILSDTFERRNYGGIVGYNERGVLTVTNCLFSGKMNTKTHLQGGIVGRSNINGTTIKNCVSVGEVKSNHGKISSGNAIIGAIKADLEDTTVTIENCYYLNGSQTCGFAENTDKGNATLKETNVVKLEESAVKGEGVASAMTKLDFKSAWSALKDDYPIPTAVKAMYLATRKVHTHAWATAWANNSSHHWHECTADECDVTDNAKKNGYGEHVYTDDADDTCNTCNYKRTIVQDDGTPSVYSGTPDTSWYKEEDSVFVLTTADQLMGFAKLVNEGNDFKDKTVKLGKNMAINEGDAATWGTTKPTYEWTPIAVSGSPRFSGTFDGQGKYISGIYSVRPDNNGLFGYTENATIENVAVINSYFENTGNSHATSPSGQMLAAVVSRVYSSGTLRNLYSNAYIVQSHQDWMTGGIVAMTQINSESGKAVIDGCVFAGTITCPSDKAGSFVGGILGGTDNKAYTVEISNCLMIGTIDTKAKGVGGIAGLLTGKNSKITDCVVSSPNVRLNTSGSNLGAVVGQIGKNAETAYEGISVTDCYYLGTHAKAVGTQVGTLTGLATNCVPIADADGFKQQSNFSGLDFTNAWVQTAEVPVPAALKDVYEANKVQHVCEFETEWTHDNESHWHACSDKYCDQVKDKAAHDFGTTGLDEKCSVCNAPNPNNGNTGTPDTSWFTEEVKAAKVFYIMTEDQLLGFAKLVDAGTCNFKGWTIYLGDNLVMNEGDASTWNKDTKGLVNWTPIGENYDAKGFQGTFDGLGHTISGIWSVQPKNNAMFSHTRNAVIKNLSITNSYFESTNAPGSNGWGNENMATFVGRGQGIQLYNLYTDAILVNAGPNTGGICGYTQNGGVSGVTLNSCVIESCVFAGQIRNANTGPVGGILGSDNGKNYSVTVKNCMFTGSIEATNANVGGLIGAINSEAATPSTLENSISTGTVTSTVDGWSNVALVGKVSSKAVVKNNSYLNVAGVKKFGTGTPAVDENNVGIGPVIVGAEKPVISTQPVGAVYESTDVAVPLKVVATVADNGTLSYQWYKSTTSATDGFTAIDGATEAEYTPALGEDAWYRCEVTSTNLYVSGAKTAKVVSDVVKVHTHAWETEWSHDAINHFHKCDGCDDVKDNAKHATNDGDDVCDTCGVTVDLADAPVIHGQPNGPLQGAEVGDQVELIVNDVTVTDNGTLSYQWYSSSVNSNENGTKINGATASTYQFPVTAAGNYYYYCVVTNTNAAEQVNETVSNVAVVHVHGWETAWNNTDANNHWHECETANCPITDNTAKNGFGAHALVHNLCSCGYVGPVSYYDATTDFDPNTDGVQHEDTSWYVGEGPYKLTNANQLFGLAKLANANNTFANKKIVLACNMVINQGDAGSWTVADKDNDSIIKWTPIATNSGYKFKGHFDGQGHYISGIFSVRADNNGLFSYTEKATIENLSLVNSYFANTGNSSSNPSGQMLGSIVSRMYNTGTLRNLYSSARLEQAHQDWLTGGVIAMVQNDADGQEIVIDSCVFAGTITKSSTKIGNHVGGILGGTDNKKGTIKINNCLMLGSINTNANCVGGIAGLLTGNGSVVSDCVVASPNGTITTSGSNFGAVVGQLGKNDASYTNMAVTDCYYLGTYTNTIGTKLGTVNNGTFQAVCEPVADAAALKLQSTFPADWFTAEAPAVPAWTMGNDYPIPTGVKGMYDGLKTIMVATTPSISTEPQGAQYNVGNTAATLTVEATGDATGVLSYQWYKSTTSATDGFTAIAGATGNAYTPDVTAAGNTWYYCKVTNTNSVIGNSNSKDSAAALVHVHDWDATKYACNEEYHWNNVCKVANCTETDKTKMGSYEQHTTFGNHVCAECEFVGAVSYYDAAKGVDKSFYDASTYATTIEFHIKNANQLYGLAELVNTNKVDFSGKKIYLDVNIVINKGDASTWSASSTGLEAWTSIGTARNGTTKSNDGTFRGTFDGQGHYVSGIWSIRSTYNNGLFCYTEKATIQNLAVVNSYFENGTASASQNGEVLAAIVGRIYDQGTLQNLYTDAYIVQSGKDWHTGGICAFAQTTTSGAKTVIDSCVFAGTIISNTGTPGNRVGGILGGTNNNQLTVEIKNCLMTGTISSNDDHVGGIVGNVRGTSLVSGCVVTTTVSYTETKTNRGPVVGCMDIYWNAGSSSNPNWKTIANTIENCYYVGSNEYAYGTTTETATVKLTNTNNVKNLTLAMGGSDALTNDQKMVNLADAKWTATEGYPVPTGVKEIYSEKALFEAYLAAQN